MKDEKNNDQEKNDLEKNEDSPSSETVPGTDGSEPNEGTEETGAVVQEGQTREVVLANLTDQEANEINVIQGQLVTVQNLVMFIGQMTQQIQQARALWVANMSTKYNVESDFQATMTYRAQSKQLIGQLPRVKNKDQRPFTARRR